MKGHRDVYPGATSASSIVGMESAPPSSPCRSRTGLLAVLLAVLLTLVPGAVGTASAAVPGAGSGLPVVALSSLPPEATDTHRLIRSGGPFPHDRDGITFQNREGLLPAKARGHYREYTVETPGLNHRGARRLVTGAEREVYYTRDHYASFVVVDVSR